MRVGIGYDSHRFAEGRRLILGGVEIEYDRGLEGHSDADVLTHAIIDAILGAAGAGDLGAMFPDDDERWRDADSVELLRTALASVSARVVNVDATVVCEAPKLGPYRAEMERTISEVLTAPVSVKATSNEGMGWVGKREGVACVAVALLDDA